MRINSGEAFAYLERTKPTISQKTKVMKQILTDMIALAVLTLLGYAIIVMMMVI
jgi:hypothetical protein